MTEILIPTLAALIGTAFGGLITYLTQRQQQRHDFQVLQETHKAELHTLKETQKADLQILKETYKTDFMAEETAKHFLSHKTHIDRSFEILQKHLGGFEENELRKILVRAGAIRIYRGKEEWWRLLSRMDEYIERKKSKK
ncbi:MAG: hypothetical protein ABJF11_19750 [Reichenbachiella sp.]|uniref:hypothetical protein n=1 Tax=Reichenbachiella sp. TaxID=2184521 RepID=UPI00326770CC